MAFTNRSKLFCKGVVCEYVVYLAKKWMEWLVYGSGETSCYRGAFPVVIATGGVAREAVISQPLGSDTHLFEALHLSDGDDFCLTPIRS